MIQLADRMEYVHSDIRGELYHEAMRMQAQGIDVLKLNTGNPAAFGMPLPESIRNAMAGREADAVPYCDFQGMPAAREAIAAYSRSKGIDGVRSDDKPFIRLFFYRQRLLQREIHTRFRRSRAFRYAFVDFSRNDLKADTVLC